MKKSISIDLLHDLLAALSTASAVAIALNVNKYERGVAWINAIMAAEFGKHVFVLVRGNGYYYWATNVTDSYAYQSLDSIYANTLDLQVSTNGKYLYEAYELASAVRAARLALRAGR